jgi:hypothetical protein
MVGDRTTKALLWAIAVGAWWNSVQELAGVFFTLPRRF